MPHQNYFQAETEKQNGEKRIKTKFNELRLKKKLRKVCYLCNFVQSHKQNACEHIKKISSIIQIIIWFTEK